MAVPIDEGTAALLAALERGGSTWIPNGAHPRLLRAQRLVQSQPGAEVADDRQVESAEQRIVQFNGR